MADFSEITQEINEQINTNGTRSITGAKLNTVLRDMIAAVNAEKQDQLTFDEIPTEDSQNPVESGGVYYWALYKLIADGGLFGGVVRPSDEPIQGDDGDDYRYFYIAYEEGRYVNFNNYEVDSSVLLFFWTGRNWGYTPLWATDQYLDMLLSRRAQKPESFTEGNLAGLDSEGNLTDSGKTLGVSVPSDAVFTDTKNTAGANYSSNFLYLIGALSPSGTPETYTNQVVVANNSTTVTIQGRDELNQVAAQLRFGGRHTLKDACGRDVDTSISSGTTSINLPTSKAVENRIAEAIQAAQVGAAIFKGTVNTGTDISGLTAYSKGWYWVVATAGTYVGQTCEVGDFIFCVSDYNSAYSASDFSVVQNNIDMSIINAKADKVVGATTGHLAGLDSNGNLTDSGSKASDFATAAQGALADTALQSYTETDPTVPSWAKQSSKPTYTASEVGALPDTTIIPTITFRQW